MIIPKEPGYFDSRRANNEETSAIPPKTPVFVDVFWKWLTWEELQRHSVIKHGNDGRLDPVARIDARVGTEHNHVENREKKDGDGDRRCDDMLNEDDFSVLFDVFLKLLEVLLVHEEPPDKSSRDSVNQRVKRSDQDSQDRRV